MTDTPDAARAALIRSLAAIPEPTERYEAIKATEQTLDRDLKELKAGVARELHKGRSWREVGAILGVTGSRAEQISRCAR